MKPTRRQFLSAALAALPASPRPPGILIDTHVHLFDPAKFPYSSIAPYSPKPQPLEDYLKFATAAKLDHVVIVHPEPYQDDHRYLEYCFGHEPSRGFFKGTCLFDPVAADTARRMEALVRLHPGRIVALRIHEVGKPGAAPETTGPIKNRDLNSPLMKATWRKARQLGLAIQMHFQPHYAPQIAALANQFPEVPIVLDHLGRFGQGSQADFEHVLKLAVHKRVTMKYSGVNYSSKEKYPFHDAQPAVRRIFEAFGPERMIWGGLGMNAAEFEQQSKLLDDMFDFTTEENRARIRGLNAMKLFAF